MRHRLLAVLLASAPLPAAAQMDLDTWTTVGNVQRFGTSAAMFTVGVASPPSAWDCALAQWCSAVWTSLTFATPGTLSFDAQVNAGATALSATAEVYLRPETSVFWTLLLHASINPADPLPPGRIEVPPNGSSGLLRVSRPVAAGSYRFLAMATARPQIDASSAFVIANVAFTPSAPPPTVVPEPGTWALLATGLGLLALVGRRRPTPGVPR